MSPRYVFDVERLFDDVRARMAERRLSQRALSEKLGMSSSLVNYHFGHGRRHKNYVTPAKVTVHLAVQMMLFLGTTELRNYLRKAEEP